jgi:cation diffusion facilitator family transporter
MSAVLAVVKIAAGVLGRSQALIADGIESIADVISSLIVYSGLCIAHRPADRSHPYGHGKAESIAAALVAGMLLAASVLIAVQSVAGLLEPGPGPAWFTLPVLLLVVLFKEGLYRYLFRTGRSIASTSLEADAWHHRSDAITSALAAVGIAIALVGGPAYAAADHWAALAACSVIAWNALRLLRPALDEVMDAAVSPEKVGEIRRLAGRVEGVVAIEKCRVRKSGLGLLMDIHVVVEAETTVRRGHEIGHDVQAALYASDLPISDVVVHVEPDDL